MFVVEEAHSLTLGIFDLYDKAGTHAGPERYPAGHTDAAHARPMHRGVDLEIEQIAGT